MPPPGNLTPGHAQQEGLAVWLFDAGQARQNSDSVNKPKVYIDGQSGTTGLRIREMLDSREEIELLLIPEAERRDPGARADHLARADLAVLCLPDEAAEEAIRLAGGSGTRIIDTSTARRIDPAWTYGLPELRERQREAIRGSARVANPGCYPQSFVLAVRPLIEAGALPATTAFTVNAVSGYSGGGRQMAERYRTATAPSHSGDAGIPLCLYGLDQGHKHLPEMQHFSGVAWPPFFVPSVDHAWCGMLVCMPLPSAVSQGLGREDVYEVWRARYAEEPFVRALSPEAADAALRDGKFLDLEACNHTNRLELMVFGEADRGLLLVGRLDNLGKGASGNAVQCMNLMLGFDERNGLRA